MRRRGRQRWLSLLLAAAVASAAAAAAAPAPAPAPEASGSGTNPADGERSGACRLQQPSRWCCSAAGRPGRRRRQPPARLPPLPRHPSLWRTSHPVLLHPSPPNPPHPRCAVAALLALRDSLTNLPPSWLASDDPCGGQPSCGGMLGTSDCAWTGIACRDGRVTEVALACLRARCYNLKGVLPGALAGASALQLIDLRGNSIGEPGAGCWVLQGWLGRPVAVVSGLLVRAGCQRCGCPAAGAVLAPAAAAAAGNAAGRRAASLPAHLPQRARCRRSWAPWGSCKC